MHRHPRVAGFAVAASLFVGGLTWSAIPAGAADPPSAGARSQTVTSRFSLAVSPSALTIDQGYTLIGSTDGFQPVLRQTYTLRLVRNSLFDIEVLRPTINFAVDQLEDIIGIDIVVAAGTVPDGATANREPAVGEIVIAPDVRNTCDGAAGCADIKHRTFHHDSNTVGVGGGSIRISTQFLSHTTSVWRKLVAHELGHTMGLGHYPGTYQGVDQVMTPGTGTTAGVYQAGDRNGLRAAAPRACPPANTNPTQAFVKAAYADLWHRPPTANELAWWTNRIVQGTGCRSALLDELLVGDGYLGPVVDEAFDRVLHRVPSVGDRAYWIGQLRSGNYTSAQLYRYFLNTPEFWTNSGSTNEGFVDQLYQSTFGYAPDATSKAYWVSQLTSGVPKTTVITSVYQSLASRQKRVDAITEHLLGRVLDASSRTYWTDVLASNSGDDIAVVRSIAGSSEYLTRAGDRF